MLFLLAIRLCILQDYKALAMVSYANLINHSPFSGVFVDARQEGDWLIKTGEEEVIELTRIVLYEEFHRIN